MSRSPLRAAIAWLLIAVLLVQPTLAVANASRIVSLAAPSPTLSSLTELGPLRPAADDALWNSFAAAPVTEGDDESLNELFALVPRNCLLTASPPSPTAGTTFQLRMIECTRNPTSYVWSGPNITPGTTTAGPTLDVTAPATPQTYAYSAIAKRGRVPSRPAVLNVAVVPVPPPAFATFNDAPGAIRVGDRVPVTFTTSGTVSSTSYYFGTTPATLHSTIGNTRYLNPPATEGVYLVRVQLNGPGGSAEQSTLVAISQVPNPDSRSVPTGSSEDIGTIAGALAVSDSGAATYSIPIQVPPGTAGLQPALALTYSSQGGDGLVGVGWSLAGLSTIHRCPSTIVQDGQRRGINYDNDLNNDNFCLDGQRLIPIGPPQILPPNQPGYPNRQMIEYRTEIDTFSRIRAYVDLPETFASPTRFQVWTKSGQVLGFGSRFWVMSLGLAAGAPRVNAIKIWPLDRIQDRMGNFADIHYAGTGVFDQTLTTITAADTPEQIGAIPLTETYPTAIRYFAAGQAPNSGTYHQVVFGYRARDPDTDIRVFDSGAGLTAITRALERIDTYVDGSQGSLGTRVKSYLLVYQQQSLSTSTGRMRLASVQECSVSDAVCLPKSRFAWSAIAPGLTMTTTPGPGDGSDRTKAVDINGDGRTDLARIANGNQAEVCKSQSVGTMASLSCSLWTLPGRTIPTQYDEVFADFNGDGLADLTILAASGTGSFVCYTNSAGTGFASCKDAGAIPNRTQTIRLWGDVDGNGQIDLVHYEGGGQAWTVCLSNPPANPVGFSCQFNRAGPVGSNGDYVEKHVLLADFNGDGRADLIGRRSESDTDDHWKVCYSAFVIPGDPANGWSCPLPTAPAFVQASAGEIDHLTVLDFNGDGLADMAARDPSFGANRWRVCLSAGDGAFEYRTTDNPPDPLKEPRCKAWFGPNEEAKDVQYGDFNGDGRTDLAVHRGNGQWEIFASTGTTFRSVSWSTGLVPNQNKDVVTGDFNGDGRTDLAQLKNGSWQIALSSGFGDLIVSVITGLDAETFIGYLPLTDSSVYTRSPNPVLGTAELIIQSPLYVVFRTDAVALANGRYRTDYSYWDLKGHSQGRGLLGFGQREMRENIAVTGAPLFNVLDTSQQTRARVTYNQGWPLAGQPVRIERFGKTAGGAEIKVSETNNTWMQRTTTYPRVVQVFQTESTEQKWELSGVALPLRRTTTPLPNNEYGNQHQVIVDVDGYRKQTDSIFSNDATNWILGRMTQSVVTHVLPDGTSKARTATFTYGSVGNGPGCVNGLLCSESVEPNAFPDVRLRMTTTYDYDKYGNRTRATQAFADGTPSRTTSTSYDNLGRFPVTVTNAAGHVEYRRHDVRFGGVACALSPNGIKVLTSYDSFGRSTAQTTKSFAGESDCTAAKDNAASTPLNFSITSWAWVNASIKSLGYTTLAQSSGAPDVRTTFDNLQREVLREVEAFNSTTVAPRFAQVATGYDALGRKRWTRGSTAGAGVDHLLATVVDYDGLNRPVRETILNENLDPAAWLLKTPAQQAADVYTQTTIAYSVAVNLADDYNTSNRAQVSTTRTPLAGQSQTNTRFLNSQGQVIRVVDAAGKASTFKHDHFGNLIRTRGPTGIDVVIGYDLRGRKMSLSDPNVGNWSYVHNGAGEMVEQVDARGYTTTHAYDALGRLVDRYEYYGGIGSTHLRTQYTFDACAKGIGKLCRIDGPGSWSRETAYDEHARALRSSTSIGGRSYHSHTLLDRNSRTRIVAYPLSTAGEHPLNLRHEYNDDGLTGPGMAWRVIDHFSGEVYWQTETASAGRYLDGRFRKGSTGAVVTEKRYDVLGRISAITAGSAASIQNATYTFDQISNLRARTDTAAGLNNEAFGYDQVNRLITTTTTPATGSAYTRSYAYDDAGNLTSRSDLAGLCAGVAGRMTYGVGHRLACADGRSYSHDANGNVTSDGLRSLVNYTPFNLPAQILQGSNTLSYTYGGDHQRVIETVNGATTTTYINGAFFEAIAPTPSAAATVWRHYVGTPEGVIAVRTRFATGPPTTRYWHKDHLGSIVAETDASGSNLQRFAYDAWGKRRLATQHPGTPSNVASASSGRGFTGHEHLDEVGLVHMNGRIYDPTIGRFLQADPIIQEVFEPQNYNRYSYVLNNPLSYTDPTGFSFWKKWGRAILAIVAAVFMQVYLMPALMAGMGIGGTAATFLGSVASGFAAGGIAGGNLQSALLGAFSAALFFGAGQIAGTLGGEGASELAIAAFAERGIGRIGLHAVAGCASSAAAGGSCKSGALSAGFAKAVGPSLLTANDAYNVAAHAVAGGIGSVLGGGKFENGAVTGAFGYLFNHLGGVAARGVAALASAWQSAKFAIDRMIASPLGQFLSNVAGAEVGTPTVIGGTGRAIMIGHYSTDLHPQNYIELARETGAHAFSMPESYARSNPEQVRAWNLRFLDWAVDQGYEIRLSGPLMRSPSGFQTELDHLRTRHFMVPDFERGMMIRISDTVPK